MYIRFSYVHGVYCDYSSYRLTPKCVHFQLHVVYPYFLVYNNCSFYNGICS